MDSVLQYPKDVGAPSMFLCIVGHVLFDGRKACVASRNMRPYLNMSPRMAEELDESEVTFVEFSDHRSTKSDLDLCKADGLDHLLVFWDASHPRQRLWLSKCRRFNLLMSANFGSSVIGIMDPTGCMVFKHRNFVERVFYDLETGDLIQRIEEL